MTGAELARRFGAFAKGSGHPQADPNEPMATLYGLDEVVVDFQTKTILLPELGLAECPTLQPVDEIDWYATVPIPGVGLQLVVGRGDPFVPRLDNPLPTKGMFVMALPYAVLRAAQQGNREQRRAASKKAR